MGPRSWIWRVGIFLILAFTLTSVPAFGAGSETAGDSSFQVHFLDQGRVDAILIVSNGEAMFIDAGYRRNGLSSIEYMKGLGITKLRYYVGTHAHKNHIGGAAPIIHQMRPDQVFIPHDGVRAAIAGYAVGIEEQQAVAATPFTVLNYGNKFVWNDLTITCLGPLKITKCSKGSVRENANSLILRIDRGRRHLLLVTGDTGASMLSQIERRRKGAIRAEILKNPHHTSSLPVSVLKKIAPKIVAICSSSLPSAAYGARILKIGATCYTASPYGNGNFILEESGGKWTFSGTVPEEAPGTDDAA